jgi:hypothetical protein
MDLDETQALGLDEYDQTEEEQEADKTKRQVMLFNILLHVSLFATYSTQRLRRDLAPSDSWNFFVKEEQYEVKFRRAYLNIVKACGVFLCREKTVKKCLYNVHHTF